jgi:hypothetical protein
MTSLRYILLASTLGASTAALAEPPTGSRLGDFRRPGPTLTAKDQAEGAKELAECLYNRRAELARQTLLASTKEAADAAYRKLMGNIECFGMVFSNDMVEERHINIPPDILRGMLAEAALGRSKAEPMALQPLPLQQVYQRQWFAMTGRHVSVDEMGACVADTNPAGVLALTHTRPTSSEENAAFSALMGNFGKCLRAGVKLQASRQALRAALSEALYQRLNAPAPAPASTAAVATAAEAVKN